MGFCSKQKTHKILVKNKTILQTNSPTHVLPVVKACLMDIAFLTKGLNALFIAVLTIEVDENGYWYGWWWEWIYVEVIKTIIEQKVSQSYCNDECKK